MYVIGAGMAGLLAAAMLRTECKGVLEQAPSLPNNHSAVLRFRTESVSHVLGIPFKPVQVMKAVAPYLNPVADALAYSAKCNGVAALRSIVSASDALKWRFIAPPDLIQQMEKRVSANIIYDIDGFASGVAPGPKISTIPMPVLMNILGWSNPPKFECRHGTNVVAKVLNVDAYCSVYIPDPSFPGSRVSLSGDKIIVECTNVIRDDEAEEMVEIALSFLGLYGFGFHETKAIPQKYAKIMPIDDEIRKSFIMWASQTHGIYSLGRFATWRPGLLLDDVVNDVRVIQRLAAGQTTYDHVKGTKR